MAEPAADLVGSATPEAERPAVRTGLSFAAGSFIVGSAIGLVSSIATSRVYGVEVIGEFALVSAPYIIASQLSQVNEGTAFVREAANLPARCLRVSALFRVVLMFSMALTITVAAVVLAIGALVLRGPVGRPDLVLPAAVMLGSYALIENVSWNIDAVLSAFRAGHVLFWARTAQFSTFLVLALVLSATTSSVWGLVFATVASFVAAASVRLCFLGRYVAWRLPAGSVRATFGELPALLRFGVVLVPAILIGSFTSQLGTWVVGSVESVAATGAYARALGLASRFNEASYRIAEILMPGMAERVRRDDTVGAADLLDRALRLAAIPLLALAAGAGGAGAGVMRVFGPGFERGADVLGLLALAYVLGVVTYLQGQGFLAAGRPGMVTSNSVLSGVVTVIAMVALERPLGMTGVALAYVAARMVMVVVLDRRLGRLLRGQGHLLGALRLLSLAATWATGFGAARAVMSVSTGLVATAVAVCLGGAASLAVAVGLRAVPIGELERLVAVVRRR